MTTELTGRALDEAAAVAMGMPSKSTAWADVPAYSTDPATIPEMLSWLTSGNNSHCVTITVVSGEVAARHHVAYLVGEPISGTTLNEALARLVVAVAAAKGAK